jgi:hypothetical protein
MLLIALQYKYTKRVLNRVTFLNQVTQLYSFLVNEKLK